MKKILFLLLFLLSCRAFAGDLLIVRMEQNFPEAMSDLQAELKKQGFQVSRVQRVDIGLEAMGYKTDKYRVVFYGNLAEMRRLIKHNPLMIAYLPLSIAIFAENDATILVAANPEIYLEDVSLEEDKAILKKWSEELQSLLGSLNSRSD